MSLIESLHRHYENEAKRLCLPPHVTTRHFIAAQHKIREEIVRKLDGTTIQKLSENTTGLNKKSTLGQNDLNID